MDTTHSLEIQTNDAQEYRRFLAWRMYCQGYRQTDIADTLQVTRGAISQWIKRAQTQGATSLRARKSDGPTPRLTQQQLAQLPTLLQKGAPAYGFRGEVWTRERVAKMIREELGVSYSHAHISKILKKIGWSQQKPLRRATQRNEQAITCWKEETLPALKKGHKKPDKPSFM